MKKITLMMSLLLSLGSMTASAQVLDRTGWKITVSGETASDGGGKNAIIDGKNNTYWHSNWGGDGAAGDASKKLPQFFQVDLGSPQTFRSIMYVPRADLNNGTVYSFKVYVSNTAFPSTEDGTSAATIVANLNEADLKMKGTFDYTGKGSQPTMVWSADQDVTGQYVLFVITDAKGNNQGKWASCAEFYLSKYTPLFESAATYDPKTAHWYAIDIHNNAGNKLWYVANEGGLVTTPTIEKGSVTNLTDNYLWTFVGNETNGFQIYNKATGKAIAYTTNATTSDNGDLFKIKASTASNNAKGFCFTKDGSNYLNEQGNKIATWTATDEGSTMHVQEPKDYILSYAAKYQSYSEDLNNAPQNAIGTLPYLSNAEKFAAYKAAYAAATAESATETEINKLLTLNKEVEANEPASTTIENGKYYRLYNHANKKIMRVDPTNNTIMNYSADANEAKSVGSVVTFKSIPSEPGRYRMMIEGKTFGRATTSNNVVLQEDNSNAKGSYIVDHVGTKFKFRDNTSSTPRYSYIHCNNGQVVGWEANNGGASWWYVVPANDVEIAMTEVNGERYASAYLPFDVKAVNGAQAYVGELNDAKNVLNMTSVNSVPANNGFVLVGNEEKATLTIGNAEALTITNALTGSNVKVALETTTGGESATVTDHRADYLVFGTSEGNVGFYKPSTANNTIAANKAFIAASSLTTGAGAIAMNFGGNTTGINNAVVASENAPIFDLSGRRVVKAVKGGVYIQNGKKFVK